MKKLLLLALFVSTAAFAEYATGDKIHFQNESTWVSAVYNKSLCVDGNTYRALINKCVRYSQGRSETCLEYKKVPASQPVNSTRQRCANYTGRSGQCTRWVDAPYVQEPVLEVEFFGSRGGVLRTETVIVPSCGK